MNPRRSLALLAMYAFPPLSVEDIAIIKPRHRFTREETRPSGTVRVKARAKRRARQ